MYNIKLDENNYFTGTYAKIGKVEGGIDIPILPKETNHPNCKFYKWENENWAFDTEKYNIEMDVVAKLETEKKTNDAICKLEEQLSASDYKIVKYQEYQMLKKSLPYDLPELHKERQNIRDKINKLKKSTLY